MSPTLLTQNSFLLCLLSMPTSYDSLERDLLFIICIIKARDFFSFFKYKIMLKYWIFSFKLDLTNILLRPFDCSGLPFPSPVNHIFCQPHWASYQDCQLGTVRYKWNLKKSGVRLTCIRSHASMWWCWDLSPTSLSPNAISFLPYQASFPGVPGNTNSQHSSQVSQDMIIWRMSSLWCFKQQPHLRGHSRIESFKLGKEFS